MDNAQRICARDDLAAIEGVDCWREGDKVDGESNRGYGIKCHPFTGRLVYCHGKGIKTGGRVFSKALAMFALANGAWNPDTIYQI